MVAKGLGVVKQLIKCQRCIATIFDTQQTYRLIAHNIVKALLVLLVNQIVCYIGGKLKLRQDLEDRTATRGQHISRVDPIVQLALIHRVELIHILTTSIVVVLRLPVFPLDQLSSLKVMSMDGIVGCNASCEVE